MALALRPSDPALLHYRSGAFYLARAGQVGRDGVSDIMLGVTAASDEPIAGGRHKVIGHHALAVIPQTSTIASHLPRAVGVAIAIDRARKLEVASPWPADAVVVCSFGDASLNHATAQAALNTAAHAAHQHLPVPLLFVCEDNGLGISVPTPSGWVARMLESRSDLRYEMVSGDDPKGALETAQMLAEWVRRTRRPAALHLRTVRYLGHAGADVEAAYRLPAEVRADLDLDPLLATAAWLVEAGLRTGDELVEEYLEGRARVREIALAAARRPQLETAADVMRPIAPRFPVAVATRGPHYGHRRRARHARARDQQRSRRCARLASRDACSSARTWRPREASTVSREGCTRVSAAVASSTRCSTKRRSWVSRSARRSAASSRSRRSSTSPTSTTPRTSSAARRQRCSSSRRGSTGTAWSCGSQATATRRGSAATSTTTTPSPSSATSPAS